MSKEKDFTGKTINSVYVISKTREKYYNGHKKTYWKCKCLKCGNVFETRGDRFSGNHLIKTCKQCANKSNGGLYKTRIHRIWIAMLQRCNNKNHAGYPNYGGRGIRVCERWLNFNNFYDDMIESYSDDLTIDRIDCNGDYCKENCRWTTRKQQGRNTRRNWIIKYHGQEKCLSEWCEYLGLPYGTVKSRLYRGWGVAKAFETPIRKGGSTHEQHYKPAV